MRAIRTWVTGIILLASLTETAIAHGTHHHVDTFSFNHLIAHSWPILIVVAILYFVLWKKNSISK